LEMGRVVFQITRQWGGSTLVKRQNNICMFNLYSVIAVVPYLHAHKGQLDQTSIQLDQTRIEKDFAKENYCFVKRLKTGYSLVTIKKNILSKYKFIMIKS
jgi:hypothetical protein